MKRYRTLFAAFAVNRENSVFAICLEVTHLETHNFTDPAAGVGQYDKYRSIANPDREMRLRRIEEPSAIAERSPKALGRIMANIKN